MKTQAELRAFTWGVMSGLVIIIACFVGISEVAGVRWQPVKIGAEFGNAKACPYVDGTEWRTYTCNFDYPQGDK